MNMAGTRTSRLVLILVAVMATVTPQLLARQAAPAKKRVAIAPFKFSAPMTDLQAAFGTSENIGAGIKAILTEKLTQSGKLSVVESDLSFLNQELALANSSAAKQGTGGRLGQIKGSDVILVGDILIFGRDDQKKSAGGFGIGGGILGGLAASKKDSKAVVVISY